MVLGRAGALGAPHNIGTRPVRTFPPDVCLQFGVDRSDCLLVHVLGSVRTLNVNHGFRFEQEPIWSYTSNAFIADKDKGLSVVAYIERVVRACAALL